MAGGDLKTLRDRLRAASGPDGELDTAIGEALNVPGNGRPGIDVGSVFWVAPPLTASIDAALALCERKLPGAWFRIDRAQDRPEATRWRVELADSHEWSWAPTAPLAILIALLEAMIGKETGDA